MKGIINTHRVAQSPLLYDKIMRMGPPLDHIYMSPGGGDIDPALYSEEDIGTHVTMPEVDQREFALIKVLLNRKQPLLGICRGHQMICAAAGGKLIQDLVTEGYHYHAHGPVFLPRRSLLREVTGITGNKINANSLHHQAIDPLHIPEGWYVSAWAGDGVIEGIANPDLPVISIQWHPEMGMTVNHDLFVRQIDLMYSWLNQYTIEEEEEKEPDERRYSLFDRWQEFNPPYLRRVTRPEHKIISVTGRTHITPVSHQLSNPNQVREHGIGSARRDGVQPSIGDSDSE